MKTRFLSSIAALLALTTTVACSQATTSTVAPAKPTVADKESARFNQTVRGGYVIKASGDGTAAIRRVFAQYGVVLVNPLGSGQFEMHLKRDPGLDALKRLAASSRGAVMVVQPNFVYHAD